MAAPRPSCPRFCAKSDSGATRYGRPHDGRRRRAAQLCKLRRVGVLVACLLAAHATCPSERTAGAEPRDWRTAAGIELGNARLLLRSPQRVVLLQPDGTTLVQARRHLSTGDLRYLETLDTRSPAVPGPQHWLMRGAPHVYDASYHCRLRCEPGAVSRWVAYLPAPPTLDWQHVQRCDVSPAGRKTVDQSASKRPVWVVRVAGGDEDCGPTLSLQLRVRVCDSMLVARGPDETIEPVAPLSNDERQRYLRSLRQIDHGIPGFRAWIDGKGLRPRSDESGIEFAKRTLLYLVDSYDYKYERRLSRRASSVIQQSANDCGGLSNLFVAILRANRIPARVLVGRWAQSMETGHGARGVPPSQAHILCEFHADGVGWIPVDPVRSLLSGHGNRDLPSFGRLNKFIALHVDTDFHLDSEVSGRKRVPYLQTPPFWGRYQGAPSAICMEETWTVGRIPQWAGSAAP